MSRAIATLGMLLVVAGCSDSPSPVGLPDAGGDVALSAAGPERGARATRATRARVAGSYTATIDFTTISLTPRGRNCLLEVSGALAFTGDIVGTATGRTSALVFATCEEASTTPPGTHPDVFRSVLKFTGTVHGRPATADLQYMGRVAAGGALDGRLVFSNGVAGRLDADGVVAVGGMYRGAVVK